MEDFVGAAKSRIAEEQKQKRATQERQRQEGIDQTAQWRASFEPALSYIENAMRHIVSQLDESDQGAFTGVFAPTVIAKDSATLGLTVKPAAATRGCKVASGALTIALDRGVDLNISAVLRNVEGSPTIFDWAVPNFTPAAPGQFSEYIIRFLAGAMERTY